MHPERWPGEEGSHLHSKQRGPQGERPPHWRGWLCAVSAPCAVLSWQEQTNLFKEVRSSPSLFSESLIWLPSVLVSQELGNSYMMIYYKPRGLRLPWWLHW